ncbi:hypothetical protein KAR91_20125 [Candidatus Pacearchaeota archaeon]|nr:hypothetical protein [Candidatus Pacearchaeota archaeon]
MKNLITAVICCIVFNGFIIWVSIPTGKAGSCELTAEEREKEVTEILESADLYLYNTSVLLSGPTTYKGIVGEFKVAEAYKLLMAQKKETKRLFGENYNEKDFGFYEYPSNRFETPPVEAQKPDLKLLQQREQKRELIRQWYLLEQHRHHQFMAKSFRRSGEHNKANKELDEYERLKKLNNTELDQEIKEAHEKSMMPVGKNRNQLLGLEDGNRDLNNDPLPTPR